MSMEMYPNWHPQQQQPFLQLQYPVQPSTPNQEAVEVVVDPVVPPSSSIKSSPFQLTAASEGINLDDLKNRIGIKLVGEALFKKFKDVQLEMIITKNGRNLFPKLMFTVEGLEPDNCYLFSVTFRRISDQKYRFTKSHWQEAGPADEEYQQQKEYPHIGNAKFLTGSQWMETELSFATLKLSNNQDNANPNAVILRSMHKYCPVMLVYRFDPDASTFTKLLEKEISDAAFIAVTAYQNVEVTQLKINNNPFARGFREGGRKRQRRESSEPDDHQKEEGAPAAKKSVTPAAMNPLFSAPFLNYFQGWYNQPGNMDLNNYYLQLAAMQQQTQYQFAAATAGFPTNFDTQ